MTQPKRKTQLKRTTPLKRGAPLKRGTIRLRRRRRGVPKDIYREVVLRDGGCVAERVVTGVACYGRLDPHHVLPRSQGGPDTATNLITLCRAHHGWVHGNPAHSKALGLLRAPTHNQPSKETQQ